MPILALEGGVSIGDATPVLTSLTNAISASTIMAIVGAVVGITVGIAFAWWAARFASAKLMAALKKGKAGA